MTTTRQTTAASALLAFALALTGCAANEPAPADPSAVPAPGAPDETHVADGELAVLDSCAAIEAVLAPYIEGLVPEAYNAQPFTEWGGTCDWREPEDATDLLEIRTVGVAVSLQTGDTAETLADLARSGFFETVEAPEVERRGGIAHALTIDAGARIIVTTVQLPDVTVAVTGGAWESAAALDAPAAVEVAQRVLGL